MRPNCCPGQNPRTLHAMLSVGDAGGVWRLRWNTREFLIFMARWSRLPAVFGATALHGCRRPWREMFRRRSGSAARSTWNATWARTHFPSSSRRVSATTSCSAQRADCGRNPGWQGSSSPRGGGFTGNAASTAWSLTRTRRPRFAGWTDTARRREADRRNCGDAIEHLREQAAHTAFSETACAGRFIQVVVETVKRSPK